MDGIHRGQRLWRERQELEKLRMREEGAQVKVEAHRNPVVSHSTRCWRAD